MCRIIYMVIVLIFIYPLYSKAGTIDVTIKGIDDGVKTSMQQDYKEAVLFAKREAIERTGIQIKSITTVKDLMVESDYIESQAEAILMPGYSIMDIGYQTDGTYLIILIGKLRVEGKKYKRTEPKVIDGDERFDVYASGIIKDRLTGNEWYIGPDVFFTWFEAKSWIEGLHIDGGGWRLPTILELKTIYKFQRLNTDLPKIFRKKTTKAVVWSSESNVPAMAKVFRYDYEDGLAKSYKKSSDRLSTGFAIRSQN